MVEFLCGRLPWSRERDKDRIGEIKMQWDPTPFLQSAPPQLTYFFEHLKQLKYEDRPDYVYLRFLFQDMILKAGETLDAPYDWERYRIQNLVSTPGAVPPSKPVEKDSHSQDTLTETPVPLAPKFLQNVPDTMHRNG